jgi:hypothetical protein
MDQLSNNIADDMNAEKLPIVPTTSFTKPSVLVPVRHSAGRPHTGPLVDSMLIGRSMPRLKQLSARLPWACARRPISVNLIGMPGLPPLPSSSED